MELFVFCIGILYAISHQNPHCDNWDPHFLVRLQEMHRGTELCVLMSLNSTSSVEYNAFNDPKTNNYYKTNNYKINNNHKTTNYYDYNGMHDANYRRQFLYPQRGKSWCIPFQLHTNLP
jgi:hypothetical protein